jgi:hypothetical protein
MKKIFSACLMNTVFLALNAYSMNQIIQEKNKPINSTLDHIQSQCKENRTQCKDVSTEILSVKQQLKKILLKKMIFTKASSPQIDAMLYELNAATSVQEMELAMQHSNFSLMNRAKS